MPVVTLGWDLTPRTEHGAKWPFQWTEGCYLLPEKRYAAGYLKALSKAFVG